MLRPSGKTLFVIASLLFAASSLLAQIPTSKTIPAKPPRATKALATKGANVKTGIIAVLDLSGDSVSVKSGAAVAAVYVLLPKTRYMKKQREAQATDFKVGDAVTLHLRKSRSDGSLQVSEMMDNSSWDWMTELRHTVTTATIKSISDDSLEVTVGAENLPVNYTVSDKTLWQKSGKLATVAEFKIGDRVSIVPRALPSGNIMASVVADTAAGAAQGKEHKSLTVHGVLQSLDTKAHTLLMKTEAGETRSMSYTDAVEIKLGSKVLTLNALKTGQHIAARMKRDDKEVESVWRITIETAIRKKTTKKTSTTLKTGAVIIAPKP